MPKTGAPPKQTNKQNRKEVNSSWCVACMRASLQDLEILSVIKRLYNISAYFELILITSLEHEKTAYFKVVLAFYKYLRVSL